MRCWPTVVNTCLWLNVPKHCLSSTKRQGAPIRSTSVLNPLLLCKYWHTECIRSFPELVRVPVNSAQHCASLLLLAPKANLLYTLFCRLTSMSVGLISLSILIWKREKGNSQFRQQLLHAKVSSKFKAELVKSPALFGKHCYVSGVLGSGIQRY